jgi:antitoxin MazE
MRTRIQKWGNSLGLRIPKGLAEAAEVREGTAVELELEHGEIVVRPTGCRYELDGLLAGVRASNLHEEIVTGEPRGREAW